LTIFNEILWCELTAFQMWGLIQRLVYQVLEHLTKL